MTTPSNKVPQLLIATGNPGKVREIAARLSPSLALQLLSLADFPAASPVEETGATFRENAEIKAHAYAGQTRCHVLADDSGLEVDALGGAPGVFSARYGSDRGARTDADRTELLLDELRRQETAAATTTTTSGVARTARFVCALSLADPSGRILYTWTGVCEGQIAESSRGANGFGYDPIFVPVGYAQTFGELSAEVKARLSHRARALDRALPVLQALAETGPA